MNNRPHNKIKKVAMTALILTNLVQIIIAVLLIIGVRALYLEARQAAFETVRKEENICLSALDRARWTHVIFESHAKAYTWCVEHRDTWRNEVNWIVTEAAAQIDLELAEEEEEIRATKTEETEETETQ